MEIWTRQSPTPARMITLKTVFPQRTGRAGQSESVAVPQAQTAAGQVRDRGGWPAPDRYTEAHTAAVRGEQLTLTNKEYELLLFLARHPNQVFSREDLYEFICGLESMGDNITVAVHVNRLREKVEENPSKPQRIQTVWGVGYRLNTL